MVLYKDTGQSRLSPEHLTWTTPELNSSSGFIYINYSKPVLFKIFLIGTFQEMLVETQIDFTGHWCTSRPAVWKTNPDTVRNLVFFRKKVRMLPSASGITSGPLECYIW